MIFFCLFIFWLKDYKTSSGIIMNLKVIKYFPNVIILKNGLYGSITNNVNEIIIKM